MILRKVDRRPGSSSPDYIFWCPGCKCGHGVWISGPNQHSGATWTWNGSLEKPTFQPSLKITGTEFTAAGKADYEAWCAAGHPDRAGKPFDSAPTCCHTVITDGVINFCGDCTHALAGKSVPMEDF